MKLSKVLMLASAVAGVSMPASYAHAVTFNLIDAGGTAPGTKARTVFEIATAYWSSVLTDNVTVNLKIGFNSLGGLILGSTRSTSQVAFVGDVVNALGGDVTSSIDTQAVTGLAKLVNADGTLDVRVNDFNDPPTRTGSVFDQFDVPQGGYTDKRTRLDNDGSANNYALAVNTANLKALGLTNDANGDPVDPAVDGSVQFNSDYARAFDFDPSNGVSRGKIDFVGVAIHEIGHALGFVSGVDDYDFFTSPGSPEIGTFFGYPITAEEALRLGLLEPGENNLENFAVGNTLDLFRYNTAGELDWSTSSGTKEFSLDGSNRVYGKGVFSLGAFNGDGNQASHWRQPRQTAPCINFLGIMNPYICGGTEDAVTALDLAAFDSIGWNLAGGVRDDRRYRQSTGDIYKAFAPPAAAAVPEPVTWMQLLLGATFIGAALRRRRPALRPTAATPVAA